MTDQTALQAVRALKEAREVDMTIPAGHGHLLELGRAHRAALAYSKMATHHFDAAVAALQKAEEEEYQPGNSRKCITQAHGFERDECGKCRFCLRRQALDAIRKAAQSATA